MEFRVEVVVVEVMEGLVVQVEAMEVEVQIAPLIDSVQITVALPWQSVGDDAALVSVKAASSASNVQRITPPKRCLAT